MSPSTPIWPACATATRCCSTGCCPSTWRRCCRSSTRRRSARSSSGSATRSAGSRGVFTVGRLPGGDRGVAAQLRAGTGRVRPHRRHRLRGHPRHRRPGRRRRRRSRIGKLSVYTAAAGIDPRRVIPVVVDVGTDNMELLNDEFYLGARHSRDPGRDVRRVHRAVRQTATRLFPNAMLHWEDFGAGNAHRILEKYRDRLLHLQRRHPGHRRGRDRRRARRRADASGSGCATSASSSTARAPRASASPTCMRDQMIREGLTRGGGEPQLLVPGQPGPDPCGPRRRMRRLPAAVRPPRGRAGHAGSVDDPDHIDAGRRRSQRPAHAC